MSINVSNATESKSVKEQEVQKVKNKTTSKPTNEAVFEFNQVDEIGDKFTTYPKKEVVTTEKDSESGLKKAAKVGIAVLAGAAAVGGAFLAKKTGHTGIAKALVGVAAVATTGALLTSCEKLPFDEHPYININEGGVTVNVDIQIDTSMVAALLEALATQNAAQWESLLQQLADMNHQLQDNNDLIRQVITVLVQNGGKLDQIIAMLGSGFEQLAGDNQELRDLLNDIRLQVFNGNELSQQQNDLLAALISNIVGMRAENNASNEEIIHLIQALIQRVGQMDNNVANSFASVMQQLDAMHNSQNQADQNRANEAAAILNAIQDLDLTVQAGYADVIARINLLDANQQEAFLNQLDEIRGLRTDVQAGFNAIFGKLNTMDQHQQQAVLRMIAKLDSMNSTLENKANEIIAKMDDMDANQQAGFAGVIASVDALDANQADRFLTWMNTYDNMSGQLKAKLNQILDAIGHMDAAQQRAYTQILAKLSELGTSGQTAMAQLLAKMDTIIHNQSKLGQIIQNQETQIQQLETIIGKIETGNLSLNQIEDFLANLSIGGGQYPQVDLSAIETLLQQILARENSNGDMLNNINNNTQLITAAVNALKAKVNDLSVQNHADLMAILNRIPTNIASCNCDCERIIQLLIEITGQLENGNFNHEGIENEFSDILG